MTASRDPLKTAAIPLYSNAYRSLPGNQNLVPKITLKFNLKSQKFPWGKPSHPILKISQANVCILRLPK